MSRPAQPQAYIRVMGSINMDHIVYVDQHVPLSDHYPASDEKWMPGGHGANQAVACARLSGLRPREVRKTSFSRFSDNFSRSHSAEIIEQPDVSVNVYMTGRIGKDDDGKKCKDELYKAGVDDTGVEPVENSTVRTGSADIYIDRHKRQRIITNPRRANDHLKPAMFPDLPDPKPDLLLLQLEIPVETVQYFVTCAYQKQIPILLNAAPIPRANETLLSLTYARVDHLICNENQADHYMDRKEKLKDRGDRYLVYKRYFEACDHFHSQGARRVVITLAELGAIASVVNLGPAETNRIIPLDRQRLRRQRHIVDAAVSPGGVNDTIGGSDTFIGGYAVEIVRQMKLSQSFNIVQAMEFGVKAAAMNIAKEGSMPGIPMREEVLATSFHNPVPQAFDFGLNFPNPESGGGQEK